MIKATQAYGFLMHLRVGSISDATFIKVLKLTENFLVRRHVCRERTNETETLFAQGLMAHMFEPGPEQAGCMAAVGRSAKMSLLR
ncbi:hypothetical protein [Agrobacterium arsenijevicii]|uniref:Transposase n=1 Tax=Agrobacterium arsenijevicii TaxID=1585697 RepID=A0ABR5DCN8_9HYPH|nr:hypothetical protein RP75_05800 [Agrobacterium arsenijevicii]